MTTFLVIIKHSHLISYSYYRLGYSIKKIQSE